MKYYSSDYRNTTAITHISDSFIGAGGGCFPPETFVRTQHGYKPIQFIRPGDIVLAYDRDGVIDFGIVTQLLVHENTEVDTSLINFNDGLLICTPNHAIYDIETNEHKLANDFKVNDKFLDLNGREIEITSISILPAIPVVYNLEVEYQHTFLASSNAKDFIRVHNGGGGKSGSSQKQAKEAPNTLRSSAVVRVLELISEGEIVGVIGGAKGVTLNGTPVQNNDGSYNYNNVTFEQRYGTPSQSFMKGFDEVEAEFSKGVTVTAASSGVVQAISSSGVDAARITLQLPDGLWHQNTSNGDLNGYSLTYAIDVRTLAGTWSNVVYHTISGKCTSPYEFTHRIDAPGSGLWEVRVRRITADDPGSEFRSTMRFERWTEIIEAKETYPDSAYVGLTVPAESVGNQIPTRGYDVQGIKVQVPINYDPITRVFTGTWDGTFKTAWCDDPAWVEYDLLTNERYGVATYMNQPITVDKWSFYEASVYNNELVSDGNGGYEARYTFNAVIQQQSDAWQLLHAVASNMRANIGMIGNAVTILQDRPKTSTKILNNANVLEGTFTYAGMDSNERKTVVNVTFNDKNDNYLPRTITVSNSTSGASHTVNYGGGIEVYGYNIEDLAAFGCTTESQAVRMAKWVLYTEAKQADLCTWGMALNAIDVNIGDVVTILDNDYVNDSGTYLSGRVQSSSGTTVHLGCPITITAGHTYTIGITNLANDNFETRTITTTTPGVYTTVSINTALPVGDYANKEFICYSTGYVSPRTYRVVSIDEQEKGHYTFTGQFYDANKYSVIESGLSVPPTTYTTIVSNVVPPVSDITFAEVFMNDGIAAHNYIDVTFTFDPTHIVKGAVTFTGRWRRDNNPYKEFEDTSLKEFRIPDTTPGVYDVIIEATNMLGRKSLSTVGTYSYRVTPGASTLEPPTNFYVQGTTGTSFNTQNLNVSWTYNTANTFKTDTLLDYILEVWTTDGITLLKTYVVPPNDAKGGAFNYLYEYNTSDYSGPSREVQFKIYSRDCVGDKSDALTKTFTNATPTAPSFTVTSGVNSVYVWITTSTEVDVNGYRIWRSTTPGFTKDDSTLVYDGPDTYVTLEVPTAETYYYAVAAYDTFGKTDLDISTEQSSTPLSFDSTKWSQSGISFSAVGDVLSWTSGTIIKNGTTSYTISAGTTTWTTGTKYIYFDPALSTTALQVSTSLAMAVGANNYPLATFTGGGNAGIKGGDGSAFISGSQVIAGTVGASQLIAGEAIITGTAQIADGIITTAHIQDAAIKTALINDAAITSAKIADAAITTAKIADANITSAKIQDAAITSAKIQNASITTAKIVDASVDTLKIQGNAVTIPLAVTNAGVVQSGGVLVSLTLPTQTMVISYIVMFGGICACSASSTQTTNNLYMALTSNLGTHYPSTSWARAQYYSSTASVYDKTGGGSSCAVKIDVPANTAVTLTLSFSATYPTIGAAIGAAVSGSWITAIGCKR